MKPSEVIKKYGWTQHQLGSEETGFCILGAMFRAYGSFKPGAPIVRRWLNAEAALLEHLRMEGEEDIIFWNDHPERTKQEVVALLQELGM